MEGDGNALDLKNDAGNSALIVAIANHGCSEDLIRWIIKSGVDVNAKNQYGSTALLEAIKFGKKSC